MTKIFGKIFGFQEQDIDGTLNPGGTMSNIMAVLAARHHYFPHVEFIKVPDDIPDWKQLLFMTWCDRFILANSSFSWWGAYLGEHVSKQRKKVTYPSPWFGPQLAHNQTHDLCPPHWNKIN